MMMSLGALRGMGDWFDPDCTPGTAGCVPHWYCYIPLMATPDCVQSFGQGVQELASDVVSPVAGTASAAVTGAVSGVASGAASGLFSGATSVASLAAVAAVTIAVGYALFKQ